MAEVIPGALIVIAKTPEPGRVKTRLSPPLTRGQACDVAWACLTDTLEAAVRVPSQRHVLLLDGEPGPWVPAGFEIMAQRGTGLAARLAAGFSDVADHAVVVAMDTPHVTSDALACALAALHDGHDSVIGPATDGGYWLLGLRAGIVGIAPTDVFSGIPMSTAATGAAQLERLRTLGLSTLVIDELRDVDTVDDVWAIAAEFPTTNLARLANQLRATST